MAFEKYKGTGTFEQKPIGNVKYWEQELTKPVTAEIGLSPAELQDVYNSARLQTQGSTNAAAEEMIAAMGGRGFAPGESGIADSAVGKILGEGANRLGQFSMNQAINERNKRFEENMALNSANLQRMGIGSDLASKMAATAASRAASAGSLALGHEQLDYQKESQTMNDLMQYMGMMQGSQQNAWAPYWQTKSNAINS
jgi:hypothetical protein